MAQQLRPKTVNFDKASVRPHEVFGATGRCKAYACILQGWGREGYAGLEEVAVYGKCQGSAHQGGEALGDVETQSVALGAA